MLTYHAVVDRVNRANTQIPQPDPQVAELEDDFVRGQSAELAQLTGQISKLSVTSQTSTDFFPYRPAFGAAGQRVTLWANYFRLDVKLQTLFKYAIEVSHKPAEEEGKDVKPTKAGKGPKGAEKAKEARGRKLQRIIWLALSKLPADSTFATEYKAQVISLKNLVLPSDSVIQVEYTEPGRDRREAWNVKFSGPTPIHVDRLMEYLADMRDPAGDANFPKFPDEVDALGIVLGHTARADQKAVAIGRGRFFALDDGRAESGFMRNDSVLSILRGYF